MDSKPFYQSKTLWANVLMLVLDVLNGAYGVIPIPADTKVFVVLAVNLILRVVSSQPITFTKDL
jgi:hypothetical protein